MFESNKRYYRFLSFAGIILILCFPIHLLAKDTIIWVNDNMPPVFIKEGADKGNGIVDGVVSIYKAHLSEYDHRHLEANMARILSMMKEGQNVCYAGFLKTPEREKYIQFLTLTISFRYFKKMLNVAHKRLFARPSTFFRVFPWQNV